MRSNIYYINDHLDKRTWTYIFGACCSLTVFIPSFHNYRIWSFLGLAMTTYTAWYMTIAALAHGQVWPHKSIIRYIYYIIHTYIISSITKNLQILYWNTGHTYLFKISITITLYTTYRFWFPYVPFLLINPLKKNNKVNAFLSLNRLLM